VIGAHPDGIGQYGRGSNGVNHAPARSEAALGIVGVGSRRGIQIGRHARIVTRQVGTDFLPGVAAVHRLEQELVGEVECVLVGHGEGHRQRPGVAEVLAGISQHGRNVLAGSRELIALGHRGPVELGHAKRVDRNVAALAPGAGVSPAREIDAAAPGAGGGHGAGAAILLGAVDPEWVPIIGGDVVVLTRGLVVPGAPALGAVHADDHALIAAEDHVVGVVGIDPELVIVVAARRTLDGKEVGAAISGAVGGGVHHVQLVCVFRIHGHRFEVPASMPNAAIIIHLLPGGASVVGTVETALLLAGVHDG